MYERILYDAYAMGNKLSIIQAWLGTTPVYPGQAAPIQWEVFAVPGNIDLGSLTASVYIDSGNIKLYTSPSIVLPPNALQDATIDGPPNGVSANDFYRFGNKTLRIDIASTKIQTVLSSKTDIQVIPEVVNSTWWEWRPTTGTPFPSSHPMLFVPNTFFVINHPYTLTGRLVNRSQKNAMIGTATLFEAPFGASAKELETKNFTVAPGGYEDIAFTPITKNWQWLIPGIWVLNPSEPQSKTFDYAVRFTMSDPYGNFYASTSEMLPITIQVSDEKKGYASGALSALGAGIIAGIFSFGLGTAAGQAIAQGLGMKAQDPPEPDSRFLVPVDITPDPPSDTQKADPRFVDFYHALLLVKRALSLVDALGDIHNRLLGARLAQSDRGIELQSGSYLSAERALQSTVRELLDVTATAILSLNASQQFTREVLRVKVIELQRAGLTTEKRRQLGDDGCSQENLDRMMNAVQDPSVARLSEDLVAVLSLLASSMAQVAREVNRDTPRIVNN